MKKRFNIFKVVFTLAIVFIFTGLIQTAGSLDEKIEIPLTNPSKISEITVNVSAGNLFITGYSGKTVLVETKKAVKSKDQSDDDMDIDVDMDDDDKKGKGMFVIENDSSGLSVFEENNKVNIRTRRFNSSFDLHIKVPVKSNLSIRMSLVGKIFVKNITGNITAQNTNGPIKLENISGTAIANSTNGEIVVVFDKVDLNNPMSFRTWNGNVDVTFPADAKFNLVMSSERGKIFSDYKLAVQKAPEAQTKDVKREKGKFQVRFNKDIHAQLNGGGKKVVFKTNHGNIYIRKQK